MRGARRGARPVVVVDRTCVPSDALPEVLDHLHGSVPAHQLEWVDLEELLEQPMVGAGAPTLVACGGDLVLRECIALVAGTATALGIVPIGSGVTLASELGVVADSAERPGVALAAALAGDLRRIDVGDANGELFVTAAGFGSAVVVPGAARQRGVGRVIARLRLVRRNMAPTTVHVDGVQRWAGRSPAILVGTGKNLLAGGAVVEIFPDANQADGEIEVAVLGAGSLLERLATWWRLVRNHPHPPGSFTRFRGEWVHVRSTQARPLEIDGHRRTPVPVLDVRVWPGALLLHEAPGPTGGAAPGVEVSTWIAPDDGSCPASHPVKANERSGIFHVPGGSSYERTQADRCYVAAEAAEADGFRAARS